MTFENDRNEVYRKILELNQSGQPAILVTVIEKNGYGPAPAGAKMLVWDGNRIAGTVGGGAIEFKAIEKANEIAKTKESCIRKYVFSDDGELTGENDDLGMVCGGSATLFFEYIDAKDNIYIFGAGHVGSAIVYNLQKLDFNITIIDPREGFAENVGTSSFVQGKFDEFYDNIKPTSGGYYIIAGHSHDLDYENLEKLLQKDLKPKYIGCIASKTKSKLFLERLRKTLGEDFDFGPLYTPIGLKTGGKTPADIAISIVAEIQAVKFGIEGNRHMSLLHRKEKS